jgi:hypothetical protein
MRTILKLIEKTKIKYKTKIRLNNSDDLLLKDKI